MALHINGGGIAYTKFVTMIDFAAGKLCLSQLAV